MTCSEDIRQIASSRPFSKARISSRVQISFRGCFLSAKRGTVTAGARCHRYRQTVGSGQTACRAVESCGTEKAANLSHAMDEVNAEFGASVVHFGTMHGFEDAAPNRIAFTQIPDFDRRVS